MGPPMSEKNSTPEIKTSNSKLEVILQIAIGTLKILTSGITKKVVNLAGNNQIYATTEASARDYFVLKIFNTLELIRNSLPQEILKNNIVDALYLIELLMIAASLLCKLNTLPDNDEQLAPVTKNYVEIIIDYCYHLCQQFNEDFDKRIAPLFEKTLMLAAMGNLCLKKEVLLEILKIYQKLLNKIQVDNILIPFYIEIITLSHTHIYPNIPLNKISMIKNISNQLQFLITNPVQNFNDFTEILSIYSILFRALNQKLLIQLPELKESVDQTIEHLITTIEKVDFSKDPMAKCIITCESIFLRTIYCINTNNKKEALIHLSKIEALVIESISNPPPSQQGTAFKISYQGIKGLLSYFKDLEKHFDQDETSVEFARLFQSIIQMIYQCINNNTSSFLFNSPIVQPSYYQADGVIVDTLIYHLDNRLK